MEVTLVSDIKTSAYEMLDEDILNLIPETCYYCGLPLQISPVFTGLTCVNEKCAGKVAKRCATFLQSIGFLGLGEKAMLRFCSMYQITIPVQLFLLEQEDLEDEPDSAYKRDLQRMITFLKLKNKMTLEQYLIYANLPSIQDKTVGKLVENVQDLDTLYRMLDAEGINFVNGALGISPDAILRGTKVLEVFYEFKEDLTSTLDQNIITIESVNTDLEKLNLVISDSPGNSWPRKKDFETAVHDLLDEDYIVKFAGSLTKSTDVLITAGDRYTSKVQKAERFGIPIVDGETFIREVQNTDHKAEIINVLNALE